jgi:hypothetical protein
MNRALIFAVVAGLPFLLVLVRVLADGFSLDDLIALAAFGFLVVNLAGIAAGPPERADD